MKILGLFGSGIAYATPSFYFYVPARGFRLSLFCRQIQGLPLRFVRAFLSEASIIININSTLPLSTELTGGKLASIRKAKSIIQRFDPVSGRLQSDLTFTTDGE
jgi:hypothetical protein